MNAKKLTTCIALAAALSLAASAMAQDPVGYLDSASFDFKYEMDVSPFDPNEIDRDSNMFPDIEPWQTPTLLTGTTPTDGYYVELNPEGSYADALTSDVLGGTVGDGIWQNSGITDGINGTGYTIELGIKVGDPGIFASGSLMAQGLEGPQAKLSYGPDGLYWGWDTGSPVIDDTSNADEAYHTIRLIKEANFNRFWVYRDGVLLNDSPLSGNSGATAYSLGVGGLGGSVLGSADVDYLRFTPGAYAAPGSDLPPTTEPEQPPTDGNTLFLDTFDTVADPAGTNDELGTPRQTGPAVPTEGISYTDTGCGTSSIVGDQLRLTADLPDPTVKKRSITTWLDADGSDLTGTKYGVGTTFLFESGQNANAWNAIVLNEAQSDETVAGLDLIFLSRASGWWAVYADGTAVAGSSMEGYAAFPAALEYDVYLQVDETGETATYNLWANENRLVTDGQFTPDAGGERLLGLRYFAYDNGAISMFDDLTIETFGDLSLDGDLNDDGFVGGDDLDIVRSFWGQNVTAGDLLSGDPSGDGFVGGDDLDIVRANWGQGTPPAPSAVPEPSMLAGLFGMGLATLLFFRRRRAG